jgi:homocitrate synthase NifV
MNHKYIVDTTLRDGEQAPGVVFFAHEKLEIARKLHDAGIREVEVGTPAMGADECRDIRNITSSGFGFRTIAWSRALKADIDLSATTGTDGINISFPVSGVQLQSIQKNRQWVLSGIKELVGYAADKFGFVAVGLQDASRADIMFLMDVIKTARNAGAHRIRIADTVGIMNPMGVQSMFSMLSDNFGGTDFEFHPHNDLGMATANALTALMSGASGVSCTVNGLGERAGNAALEELVTAWYYHENGDMLAHPDKLIDLCTCVANCSLREIDPQKPVVGRNVFRHETGIHVRSLLNDKLAYQPFDEAILGRTAPEIVIGKHSGRTAIAGFFASHGVDLSAVQLGQIADAIQNIAARTKGGISTRGLWNVYHSCLAV